MFISLTQEFSHTLHASNLFLSLSQPIFIFCFVQAKIERPSALGELLSVMCDRKKMSGETGYYLASFHAVSQFHGILLPLLDLILYPNFCMPLSTCTGVKLYSSTRLDRSRKRPLIDIRCIEYAAPIMASIYDYTTYT